MQNKSLVSLLRMTAFFLFLGRAWQHFLGKTPYDTLYRSDKYLGKVVDWLLGDKNAPIAADVLYNINTFFGVLLLLAACSVLLINKRKSYFKICIKIGWCILFLTAFGYYVDKFRVAGQFFEYSAQLVVPYLLLLAVKYKMKKKFLFWAKFAIALTFVCHGLYAVGYYPVPGNFMNMMINSFGMTNDQAQLWLFIIGIADFIFAVGVFLPKGIWRYFMYYGLVWGFLTAFARLWVNIDASFLDATISQYTFEFLVRMPHFIVPLILLKYRRDIVI